MPVIRPRRTSALWLCAALIIAVVAGYGGSVVGKALHRMPIARGVDGFLGIFLNVAIAVAVIVPVFALATSPLNGRFRQAIFAASLRPLG